MNSLTSQFLEQFALQLPLWIVYGLGFVFGLIYWRRHPTACLFLVLGMAVLAATGLFSTFLYAWIPHQMEQGTWSADRIATTFRMLGFVSSVFYAVGNGLLILAALKGRPGG